MTTPDAEQRLIEDLRECAKLHPIDAPVYLAAANEIERLRGVEAGGLDNHPMRQQFADAIMGALMFGFQQNNEAPPDHWLKPFWDFGHEAAEAAKRAERNALLMARALAASRSTGAADVGEGHG